jgi:DNA-binding response OmpR family regulator
MRLAIVDDNIGIVRLLTNVFEQAGHTVVATATTLDHGLSVASMHNYDAMILDVNLGTQRSEKIAELLVQKNIPFIVISGGPRDELDSALLRAPFIPKPIDLEHILATIAHVNSEMKMIITVR